MIVTLKERRIRAAEARRREIARICARLADEASRRGGRYLLFGSAARGDLRGDSDIDLLADFPKEKVAGAITAADEICILHRIPCDILDIRHRSDAFLRRVLPDAVALE